MGKGWRGGRGRGGEGSKGERERENRQLHTGFPCVCIGSAHRDCESERADNLSVFIVKPPNLKLKHILRITLAFHMFALAVPIVIVRAREQTT